MGAVVGSGTGGKKVVVGWADGGSLRESGRWFGRRLLGGLFGGALVLSGLVQVAFDHGGLV